MLRVAIRAGFILAAPQLQGDDHWLSNAATRLEVLADTEQFLHQYLK